MIDIVRPEYLAGEFVHQVIFFIQTLGRGQYADAITAGCLANIGKLTSGNIQGSVPTHLDPFTTVFGPWSLFNQISAHARLLQSFRVMDKVITVATFNT